MASYTSNFSSWSSLENLLVAAETFESGPSFDSLENQVGNLINILFSDYGWTYSLDSSSAITATYYDGSVAHIYGSFSASSAVISAADFAYGGLRLAMTGSINANTGSGSISAIDFQSSSPFYHEHLYGALSLDSGDAIWSSWSVTEGTALGNVTISATGRRVDSATPSATYSTVALSDDYGNSASISGLNYTVIGEAGTLDYVAILQGMLAGNDLATGSIDPNELRGYAGNDTLDGGGGADTLVGGTGNDTYIVDNAGDVLVELAAEGVDSARSSVSLNLAANMENLVLLGSAANGTGNELNNVITGNSSINQLDGGLGNDTLIGGAGNDTYLVDAALDVLTENAAEGSDSVFSSSVSYILAANLENLTLTGSALSGTGNAENNLLTGNAQNNTLSGGLGHDTLDGGSGADTLVGGAGNDTYEVDDAADVLTELANEGSDTVRSQLSYTLAANLENLVLLGVALNGTGNDLANKLTGNANANSLVGGAGNDSLDGGSGTDTLIGGTGDDTYTMDNLGDVITELAGEGNDTLIITASAGSPIVFTAPDNIEIVKLGEGSANIALATNGLTQVAATTGIDSIVFTGGGSMTLGAGIENLTLSQATGNIGGTGGADNNLLEGNSGANLLDGGAGNDTLKGYAGEDILLGGLGNDLLNGGKGADRLEGGLGDDTYVIDNSGDQIVEALGAGTDTVRSSLRSTTLGDNLENLVLEGTAKANGIGNALANQLTGNAKANCLTGGAGADTFIFNTTLSPLNVDTLTDFTTGQDKIALDDSIFTTLSGASSTWYHSVTSLAQTDADDRIVYNASTGALYYDDDGSGAHAAVRFAMLAGALTLSAADIQVV